MSEEASPICRGKNLSWETVMLFFNYMPKEPMLKDEFNYYVEKNINSWTQTHSQIARQLAFYYEYEGVCYPRFNSTSTLSDLFNYMVHWAHNYFVPNPYAPSLKEKKPTSIYSHLIKCIENGNTNFDSALDSMFGIALSSHDKVKVYLQNYTNIKFDNDIISLNECLIDECNILNPSEAAATDCKEYFLYFECPIAKKVSKNNSLGYYNLPLQQIFYGAPGTGKSHTINEITKGESVIRTTFHPDSDYSTFVGAYKPTMSRVRKSVVIGDVEKEVTPIYGTSQYEEKITYKFVKQAFLKAYLGAWKKIADGGVNAKPQYLIIEEINRGNCAQIFGDLFQLLDRQDNGYSSYPIEADSDLQQEIERAFWEDNDYKVDYLDVDGVMEDYTSNYDATLSEDILHGRILLLPNNLFIWATMNTSDQSLFPIDSAFKRRWDWQYMPIEQPEIGKDARKWKIKADDHWCYWWEFLQAINQKIEDVVNSEDKQLGYFFTKPTDREFIDANTFVNKVIFYLWNDVFKDEDCDCFVYKKSGDNWDVDDIILNDNTKLSFRKFISSRDKVDEKLVHWFINNLLKSEEIEILDDDKQEVKNPGEIAWMRKCS